MGRKRKKRTTSKPSQALAAYLAKLGGRGGTARAKNLTAEERRAGARKAAQARWAKPKRTGESVTAVY